jgi:hypothetical protein
MTSSPRYQYSIASGWNVALVSLVNIETIKPTGDVYFYPPQSYGFYNAGQDIIRSDGSLYVAGYPSTQWIWAGNPSGRLTPGQEYYLQQTYCNGGRSGQVTILTTTDVVSNGEPTYARFNAIIRLSKLPDSGKNFKNFGQFVAYFTRMVAL